MPIWEHGPDIIVTNKAHTGPVRGPMPLGECEDGLVAGDVSLLTLALLPHVDGGARPQAVRLEGATILLDCNVVFLNLTVQVPCDRDSSSYSFHLIDEEIEARCV